MMHRIRRSIRGIKKNLYKLAFCQINYINIMDLMPDPDNYLELNVHQRAAVLRMAGFMIGRQVFWPEDEDRITLEAIAYRTANRLPVFPHLEVELLDDEDEPPAPPGTPEIRDQRAPE